MVPAEAGTHPGLGARGGIRPRRSHMLAHCYSAQLPARDVDGGSVSKIAVRCAFTSRPSRRVMIRDLPKYTRIAVVSIIDETKAQIFTLSVGESSRYCYVMCTCDGLNLWGHSGPVSI